MGPLCVDFNGQNNSACGRSAATCASCNGGTCVNGQCTMVTTCSPSSCPNGCCQGNLCVPFGNQNANQCGAGGQACSVCPPNNSCALGTCSPAVACDFFSCAGCCSGGTCQPASVQSPLSCGVNGATCTSCPPGATCSSGVCVGGTTCNPTTCAGCCNAGTCVPAASTTASVCGHSGNVCSACGPGQLCSSGVCIPGQTPACLVLTPTDLDFGSVQTGCRSEPITVTIRNVCTFNVTVTTIGVVASVGTGFTVSGPATPVNVPPNGSGGVQVAFAPTSVGRSEGILVVGASHSSGTFAYQTAVTGFGATSGLNQDRFQVPLKTDVVMIVDNSGSMGPYQQALGSNANAFLAYAISAGIDFNLGVTTTDMTAATQQGRFQGPAGQRVLSSSAPNLLSLFNQRVNVGTGGSGTEFMSDPAVASLSPALLTTTNANFLRSEAALAVLAFTDAADQSARSTAEYLQTLQSVKGLRRRNQFSFSSISPTFPSAPPGCSNYDNSQGSQTRLRELASGSGGVLSEICNVGNTQLWRTEATRVGQIVFGGRATWFLTRRPSPATSTALTVSLNGATVPELGPNGRNWSYDAARNAIVFEAVSQPAPGQLVGIDYGTACTQPPVDGGVPFTDGGVPVDGGVITNGNYRLVDIATPTPTRIRGRLEVFRAGAWGTVCDDNWDAGDSQVACRSLGYPSTGASFIGNLPGPNTLPINMDEVGCTGSEPELLSCPFTTMHDCTHAEDVGLECTLPSDGGVLGCNALTCLGCCDSAGICRPGTETAACGIGGAACAQCLTTCLPPPFAMCL